MNRGEHFLIGAILCAIIFFLINKINWNPLTSQMGWIFIGVFVGSVIPDIIEPAKDYKHRKKFHSWTYLKWVAISVPFFILVGIALPFFWFLAGLAIGYCGHLLADSTTKMGLPK